MIPHSSNNSYKCRQQLGPSSLNREVNVVPMIDILLVLLIIFMMQVPLNRKAMDAQVPPQQQQQQEQDDTPSNNIVLSLLEDGTYEINGQISTVGQLDSRFHEIYDIRPQKILFLKSATSRLYEDIIEVMDIARGAGVQVIGFTPPEQNTDN